MYLRILPYYILSFFTIFGYLHAGGIKQNIDNGIKLFKDNHFHKSLSILMPYAKQGKPKAEFYIGLIYDMGSIDLVDKSKAVIWYAKAANQGLSEAEYDMGVMLSKGEGIQKDLKKALKWYKKSAAKNNKNAMYNLAVSYQRGYGCDIDIEKSKEWYKKASAIGSAKSAFNLASYYYKHKNYQLSYIYYKKAAKYGHPNAMFTLGYLYQYGLGTDINKMLAIKWYTEAAITGQNDARKNLSILLRERKKEKEATFWAAHTK